MKDMRGSDVVIIGFLIYLVWDKVVNSPSGSMQSPHCNLTNMPNVSEPLSTMYGPAWTRLPPEVIQP